VTGGCAGVNPFSGRVGPVEWVVADMTRTAESGLLRWTYSIRLRSAERGYGAVAAEGRAEAGRASAKERDQCRYARTPV
jgi:hypothetical protein